MSTQANPRQSPITRAYLEAQVPIGGLPSTEREQSLFEALQESLAKNYETDAEEKDDIDDLREELQRAEESELAEHERAEAEGRLVDELQEKLDKIRRGGLGKDMVDIDEATGAVRNIRVLLDRFDRRAYGDIQEELRSASHALREASETMSRMAAELLEWREAGDVT